MAQQPIGLFGLKLVPGEEYDLDVFDDVRITNISFGENVVGNARTVVKIHHRSVPSFYDDEEDDEDEFDSEESMDEEDSEEDLESDEVDAEEELANTSKASATKVNGISKKEKKVQEALEKAALLEGLAGGDVEDDEDDDEDEDEDEEEEEEQTFVICSLYPGKLEQATVDLHISTEDQVRFSITGDNPVELLGSYLSSGRFDDDPDSDELFDSSDEDSEDYSDSDEEIDSDELELLEAGLDDDSDDEEELDEDDLDEEDLALLRALQDDEDDEDDDDDEDMDDSDERFEEVSDDEAAKRTAVKAAGGKKRSADELDEEEDDEETAVTDAQIAKEAKALGLDVSKLTKNQRKKLNKRLRAADSSAEITQEAVEATQKEAKDAKVKTPASKKPEAKADAKVQAKKVTLPSGVVIEDVKVGTGAAAKSGNRLSMRYVGRLQSGKQFDANTKGKPFTFKLGKGDVIGGWDEGLKGMKVGGERRLVIPPKMGYGSRGAPPDIPGNATLVFDVKLVEIK